MKDRELATFCKELAIMVRAGMTLEESIEFMQQDSDDDYIQQIIKKIKVGLKDGKSIDKALQSTQEFPEYMIHMIQVGMESKHLSEVLEVLTQTYLKQERLQENLKRAINYPIYLSSIMCVVMLFFVVKVIPIFDEVFIGWTGELTQIAKVFVKLGKWIQGCSIGILIVSIIMACVGIILVKTAKGREISVRILDYTSISEKIGIARLAWVMGLMLGSGFNLEQSLQKSLVVVENKAVQQRVKRCIQMLGEKELFEDALTESKVFSRSVTRLIISGFTNGQLKEVIKQVGEEYQRNVQYALENKIQSIETISVGVTSIIIGSILLTIMLPLMGILTMLS